MRYNTLFLSVIVLVTLIAASTNADIGGKRTLVVLDDLSIQQSHSIFFKSLSDRGYKLQFVRPEEKVALEKYGDFNYDHLILFAPTSDANQIISFVDAGNNVLIAGSSVVSDTIRDVASEVGMDIEDDKTNVFDHTNFDKSIDNQHNLIVADQFIKDSPIILQGADKTPVLFKGIGHAIRQNELNYAVLTGASTAYSGKATTGASTKLLGKRVGLVSSLQARNSARVTFSGSLELFSDNFFNAKVNGNQPSGNQKFVENLVSWTFQERGILRTSNLQISKGNDTNPTLFTVKDDIVEEFTGGKWVPYVDQLELEIIMLDPYIRTFIKGDKNGVYSADLKLPDVYGVYTFESTVRRPGYSKLESIIRHPIRPFRHDSYERFIPSAYPYYAASFSMLVDLGNQVIMLHNTKYYDNHIRTSPLGYLCEHQQNHVNQQITQIGYKVPNNSAEGIVENRSVPRLVNETSTQLELLRNVEIRQDIGPLDKSSLSPSFPTSPPSQFIQSRYQQRLTLPVAPDPTILSNLQEPIFGAVDVLSGFNVGSDFNADPQFNSTPGQQPEPPLEAPANTINTPGNTTTTPRVPPTKKVDRRVNRKPVPMQRVQGAKDQAKSKSKKSKAISAALRKVFPGSGLPMTLSIVQAPTSIINRSVATFKLHITGDVHPNYLVVVARPTNPSMLRLEDQSVGVDESGIVEMRIKLYSLDKLNFKTGVLINFRLVNDTNQVLTDTIRTDITVPIPFIANTKDLSYPKIKSITHNVFCEHLVPNEDMINSMITADRLKWGSTNELTLYVVEVESLMIKHIINQGSIPPGERSKTVAFCQIPKYLFDGNHSLHAQYVKVETNNIDDNNNNNNNNNNNSDNNNTNETKKKTNSIPPQARWSTWSYGFEGSVMLVF
ncbi:dolichyl-diphosphooligosaccharide-protein glycotransferase [Heterostelium album PN500]|uniref:Dolichyl-diphosphooligosaccharide--protein glycosyltransferase 48 kDa subunit n=1 Tax=Heterostelium pallidum (strain ATCC 26659 / Pp 5 / PN500) TaxID=670386 RepID=D3BQ06_HETP5|nr:dolichyl-diphosphooligosaccharide-protein glycotransferase [Heterostelium album PN500]EFA76557.1 dolichyl-diphosphooligosaccharide-protein glycotransferase [Heterostelium album PN500]|eukprot:XP_020428689.1 dolichyl-diphosphooligosaccharide-protein glycotransferase [Heterostelium album PN500]